MTPRRPRIPMSGILLVPLLLIANGLRAAESQLAPPRSRSMSVNAVVFHVFLEDAARGPITLRVNRASAGQENAVLLKDVQPGALTLNLSALEPDLYLLLATSPGYATALVSLTIKQGEATVFSPQVTLYRTRYAIIRYSVNRTGTRALTGPGVEQGRCAVRPVGTCRFLQVTGGSRNAPRSFTWISIDKCRRTGLPLPPVAHRLKHWRKPRPTRPISAREFAPRPVWYCFAGSSGTFPRTNATANSLSRASPSDRRLIWS